MDIGKITVHGQIPSKSNCYQDMQQLIIESYSRLGNIWKVGAELGLKGQYVHSVLTKLGLIHKMNYFTDNDIKLLSENYAAYKSQRKLGELAKMLGRTKQFICRKAKQLGLTDKQDRPLMRKDERIRVSDRMKEFYRTHLHPRGYSGHHHDSLAKKKISTAVIKAWQNPESTFNSPQFRQLRSDRMHEHRIDGKIKSKSNRTTIDTEIGGQSFTFKSSWEYGIALRLDSLKSENVISDWQYEPEHFVFNDCKRGIRSYCPDFKVTYPDGEFYIEVKGWEMKNAMKRIEMFKERYPQIKLYLINGKEYNRILSEAGYLRRRAEQIKRLQDNHDSGTFNARQEQGVERV